MELGAVVESDGPEGPWTPGDDRHECFRHFRLGAGLELPDDGVAGLSFDERQEAVGGQSVSVSSTSLLLRWRALLTSSPQRKHCTTDPRIQRLTERPNPEHKLNTRELDILCQHRR